MDYSELKAMDLLPNFTLEQFGKDCFIYNEPTEEDNRSGRIRKDQKF